MTKEDAIALLEQYGWIQEHDNLQGAVTGKWLKIAQGRTWEAQVSSVPQFLYSLNNVNKVTVYIAAQAINNVETVGPVDPLYHDTTSLENRLIALQ